MFEVRFVLVVEFTYDCSGVTTIKLVLKNSYLVTFQKNVFVEFDNQMEFNFNCNV